MAPPKLEQLRALLRSYGSCLVAYSGGVDSVLLSFLAHEVLGDKSLAVIADSPSLPRRELEEALAIASKFHFPVHVIQTEEFKNPHYTSNPANRCYFCKHELFTQLVSIAQADHFAVIAYGENASDDGDYRPGMAAAAEFEVRAPLKEAGLTKTEIRELSARLGLGTFDKPQMACLSSRIPHGEEVTPAKLRMIEQAESVLRGLGFHDVRVRHHELGGQRTEDRGRRSEVRGQRSEDGDQRSEIRTPISDLRTLSSGLRPLARIEVGGDEMSKFLLDGNFMKIAEALKQVGYAHVTLDLEGYRRGSLNEVPPAGRQVAQET